MIEEHISSHPNVIPTIKSIKGVDIFFDGQPFDLKVTYIPSKYDPYDALKNPKKLAVWLYENQGEQRFGDENRMFVVLFDRENPEKSWELKRDFNLIFNKIDDFFGSEKVSDDDQIVFTFRRKSYTTLAKVLLITR